MTAAVPAAPPPLARPMVLFAVNLAIALGALMVFGSAVYILAAGFLAGYAALFVATKALGVETVYFRRMRRALRLGVFFLYELVVSSVQVFWDVVTPQHLSRPALIEMPLDVESDIEILLVTGLISLTPGTLSLDVSDDRKTLHVHAMFADDPDELVAQLKNGMERMVREVFEP